MIDTHLHVWNLAAGWYDWNTSDLGPVHRDSTLAAIRSQLAASDVSTVVVVQAADTLAETDWLLRLAATEPLIGGIVGYLPLDDPAELDRRLTAYADTALVGVRQLWHNHPDLDELTRTTTLDCLALVGEAGLPVDVPDAFLGLWSSMLTATDRVPGTTFVLDHCGKPPFGQPDRWDEWESGMHEFADRPNVIVKLSGLFSANGRAFATDDELDRVVEIVRERCGATRTMIGSDWPMAVGRLTYAASIARLHDLTESWTAAETEAAFGGTAAKVYNLRPAA